MVLNVAAVVTVWSKNSHADVIVGKFLRGFPTDNGVMCAPCLRLRRRAVLHLSFFTSPVERGGGGGLPPRRLHARCSARGCTLALRVCLHRSQAFSTAHRRELSSFACSPAKAKVVSLYMDQVGPLDSKSANFSALDDLGTALAEKYGVRLCGSIAEALCLGGDECAVDGILAIGEHGDYPVNSKNQRLYPRRHFWEQITGVLSTCPHRSQVPIFTDKHLAVTWDDAAWIYKTGKELGLVHMAGSSVPHCFWRDPWLEHPNGSNIEAAVMLSYGDLEAYGYHGLEALQAMIERRPGGEAGIRAVQALTGDDIWAAAKDGRWSLKLGQHALGLIDTGEEAQADAAAGASGEAAVAAMREAAGPTAVLFLSEHSDGFRSALLHCGGGIFGGWAYAAQVDGEVVGTAFNGNEAPNYPPFSALGRNIDQVRFLIPLHCLSARRRGAKLRGLLISGP